MAAAAGMLATGCVVRPTSQPVGRINYLGPTAHQPDTLVILLPGWGDRARDFERYGLIGAMRGAGIDADVVAVNAHSGCCWRNKLAKRLEIDVIERARAEGYASVWVAGISMGAQGALLAAERIVDIDGVVLLSPYLGAHPVTAQIEAAGGLHAWSPPSTGRDTMTRVWCWIKETGERGSCPLYLGCGAEERWRSIAIMQQALPDERVVVTPGGHDWPTWRRAWPELLKRGAFVGRQRPA
jgi:S-formylglutathione hydrolase FrmB